MGSRDFWALVAFLLVLVAIPVLIYCIFRYIRRQAKKQYYPIEVLAPPHAQATEFIISQSMGQKSDAISFSLILSMIVINFYLLEVTPSAKLLIYAVIGLLCLAAYIFLPETLSVSLLKGEARKVIYYKKNLIKQYEVQLSMQAYTWVRSLISVNNDNASETYVSIELGNSSYLTYHLCKISYHRMTDQPMAIEEANRRTKMIAEFWGIEDKGFLTFTKGM